MRQYGYVSIACYLTLNLFFYAVVAVPSAFGTENSARKAIEQRLLKKAEAALIAGKLTQPAQENAYDLYQSVLMMNPGNIDARAGQESVFLAYVEQVRQALARDDFNRADRLLRRAEDYFQANKLLRDLRIQSRQARAQWLAQKESMPLAMPQAAISEFALPASALTRKDDELIGYLGKVARRVSGTDETVMIYARTDAEGRWIYQQMKAAVTGYRIRGDIRIAKDPKLSLLPPL